MKPLSTKKLEFETWGCTNGEKVHECKKCSCSEPWNCLVFGDSVEGCKNYEFLYVIRSGN